MDIQKIEELQKEFPKAGFRNLHYKLYILETNFDLIIDLEQNKFIIIDRYSDKSYVETFTEELRIENIKAALKNMNL